MAKPRGLSFFNSDDQKVIADMFKHLKAVCHRDCKVVRDCDGSCKSV